MLLFTLGKPGVMSIKIPSVCFACVVLCSACFTFLFLWTKTNFLFASAQVKIGMT